MGDRIENLIKELKDFDWRVRAKAARALGAIKDARAIAPLMLALFDTSKTVHDSALEALKKINPKWPQSQQARELSREFIIALKDEDRHIRKVSAEVLGEIKEPQAVEPLIIVLKDRSKFVRCAAASALGKIGDKRAVAPLISALIDSEEIVRGAAWRSLEAIDPNWATSNEAKKRVLMFIFALRNTDSGVRRIGAMVLGKIKDVRTVEHLISALKDADNKVRSAAAWALGEIQDKRAVEPLISALNDKYKDVRIASVKALGEIRDARAVSPLISALRDSDKEVRSAVIEALVRIGRPALGPLITALRDSIAVVRSSAVEALGRINPNWASSKEAKTQIGDFIKALRDKDSGVRSAAEEFLGKVEPNWAESEKARKQVSDFISALKDSDAGVREAAARVLGKIKDRRAIGPLILALLNSEKIVQNAAWNNLDAIDPNWAESEEARKRVPDFISALKENDENLRITAVRALGKIKDARAVGPLISTLLISKLEDIKGDVVHFIPAIKDVNASVRREVAWALGEIKDARAVSSLISALKDSDKNVRKAAKEALEKIKESQILLVSSFPNLNLLCMRCYLRAEKRTARVGIFSSFQYVVCRRCGSSGYLQEGVRKVVGMIGGEVKDYELRDGVLYLSLWSEEKGEGRNADIDILEIIDTEGISYDYAINVVIRTLKNDVDRKSNYLKNIPVIIKGNPPIPQGSMNLLQNEFKEIIKG